MASFTIKNLQSSAFCIPDPVSRVVPAGRALTFVGPSHLMDTPAMRRAIRSGAISVTLGPDEDTAPDDIETTTLTRLVTFHEPIVTPAFGAHLVGTQPTLVNIGSTLLLEFSANDLAWRTFKIPSSYVDQPSFHIHWTKGGDDNESGKVVKWRITYSVFPGEGEDLVNQVTPHVVEFEDTYTDSGTTTRVMHRTPNLPLMGLTAGYYMGVQVGPVTPAGTPLTSNPLLMSLDLMFRQHPLKS